VSHKRLGERQDWQNAKEGSKGHVTEAAGARRWEKKLPIGNRYFKQIGKGIDKDVNRVRMDLKIDGHRTPGRRRGLTTKRQLRRSGRKGTAS